MVFPFLIMPFIIIIIFGGGATEGKRIALTDSDTPTPFLCTGASNEQVQWSGALMMRLIHQAQVVEVGARGIRFVDARWFPSSIYEHHRDGIKDSCESTPHALCRTPAGLLFPTSEESVLVTGQLVPVFNSSLAERFALESVEACNGAYEGGGQGRTVVIDQAIYTASACDVMQGHLVTMFKPQTSEALLVPQTFGPMAYTVILAAALLCIYGASSADNNNSKQRWLTLGVCAAATIACCMVYGLSGIPFLTIEDEIHFWMAIAGTLSFCAVDCGLLLLDDDADAKTRGAKPYSTKVVTPDVSIYMLGAIADALYRTPETPYAGIFVVAFAIRTWQKSIALFLFNAPASSSSTMVLLTLMHLDLLYSTLFMCLTTEIGFVPQFADREDWPIYAGVGGFATFLAAWTMRS